MIQRQFPWSRTIKFPAKWNFMKSVLKNRKNTSHPNEHTLNVLKDGKHFGQSSPWTFMESL